jgi:hypothetical protein
MSDRIEIPTDAARLVLARKDANMINPSLEIDDLGNVIPRNRNGNADYTVIVRKSTNSGNVPRNARNLRACKGLTGCKFVECSQEIFGNVPRNHRKTCPTLIDKKENIIL